MIYTIAQGWLPKFDLDLDLGLLLWCGVYIGQQPRLDLDLYLN